MLARRAAAPDLPQLLSLVERYWQFEGITGFDAARSGALLQRLLAEPAWGSAWVAESAGELVGYLIAVSVLSLEHQGMMAEIDEFFVVPAARGRGAGAALLSALEAALAAQGCVRLQLQIGNTNHEARAFYARRGFGGRDGYQLLDKPLREPRHGTGSSQPLPRRAR
jgi:GNAT superfamily N-acetyltransferase